MGEKIFHATVALIRHKVLYGPFCISYMVLYGTTLNFKLNLLPTLQENIGVFKRQNMFQFSVFSSSLDFLN